ncbi:hypothetical protein HDR61_01985 [bacterium]|nr:hypothetical protein [bacterium]
MFRFLVPLAAVLICVAAHADEDCLGVKVRPSITVTTPDWTKSVVQPMREMDLLHGDVIATLTDNYDITGDVTPIEDGYCVYLKSVAATIGYSDFLVQIDIRNRPDSCSYDAILSHEDEHIRAYLSIIDDFKTDLHNAVYTAADSVMPIFVRDAAGIDGALDELNARLQSHPDVVLVKQKITAAEEIRNKKVDLNDNGASLKKCMNEK